MASARSSCSLSAEKSFIADLESVERRLARRAPGRQGCEPFWSKLRLYRRPPKLDNGPSARATPNGSDRGARDLIAEAVPMEVEAPVAMGVHGPTSVLNVHPTAENRHWPAIRIVTGVGGELAVGRQGEVLQEVDLVVGLKVLLG